MRKVPARPLVEPFDRSIDAARGARLERDGPGQWPRRRKVDRIAEDEAGGMSVPEKR
jgi:hypothetical protein